jgi:hypothetical protein
VFKDWLVGDSACLCIQCAMRSCIILVCWLVVCRYEGCSCYDAIHAAKHVERQLCLVLFIVVRVVDYSPTHDRLGDSELGLVYFGY